MPDKRAPRDPNRVTGLLGASNVDGEAMAVLVDHATGRLLASVTGSVTVESIEQQLKDYSIAYGPLKEGNYFYLCYEKEDGSWYIKRKDTTTAQWLYFKGSADVATGWTGRDGHEYALRSEVFGA